MSNIVVGGGWALVSWAKLNVLQKRWHFVVHF